MQTPLLTALRRAAPSARITALGAAPATDLLRADARIAAVVAVQQFGVQELWAEAAPGFDAWLQEQAFDLILDPHAAATPISGSIWKLSTEIRESDQDAEKRRLHADGSGTQALLDGAADGWGIPVPERAVPHIGMSREADARASAFLPAGSRAPVAVAPFASSPLKQWPVARFATLARAVVQQHRRPVLILSSPDNDSAGELERRLPETDSVRVLPTVPLDVMAAVLRRCAAIVCNDTGVMHVAAAVDTPVVSVFGPTDPGVYGPRGVTHVAVGGRDVACEHRVPRALGTPACWSGGQCLLSGTRSCIDVVQVDAVMAACHRVLSRCGRLRGLTGPMRSSSSACSSRRRSRS